MDIEPSKKNKKNERTQHYLFNGKNVSAVFLRVHFSFMRRPFLTHSLRVIFMKVGVNVGEMLS